LKSFVIETTFFQYFFRSRQFSIEQRHTVLAEFLHKKVKVLCWIMTSPDTLKERAYHVNKTWGKRCNKILFMSTQLDDEMDNVIALPVTEGRDFLWSKTKEALRYIYRYHMDEYDWFLKADDDT
jgi:glycoprotein-N-acetylgalactosamine 3-beta-galactosyltransferase